jgi:STE24 endopeptidase
MFSPKVFEFWPVTKVDSFWWAAFVATALLNVLQIPSLFFDWHNHLARGKIGFNKSTKKLWVVDKIKGTFLGFGLSYLLLALLIWMYRSYRRLLLSIGGAVALWCFLAFSC